VKPITDPLLHHEPFMQRALYLATVGLGNVSPNPMVGAVIVHNGKIIGEGWHQKFAGPHAEVNAINSVQNQDVFKESTIYVTLEPCSHHGKTPPCADLLISHQFKTVIIASEDPNPLVAGKGIAKLKAAGIEVATGVCSDKAKGLNRRFFTNFELKRPYVILKWAQSADGFIAPGLNYSREDKQLSNALSQQLVHKWRAEEDAIMVGYNTLLFDNPKLNVRLLETDRQPTRITWDEKGMPAGNHHFFDGSLNSFVFNHTRDDQTSSHRNIQIPLDDNSLATLLSRLLKEDIGSVIVEGGTKLLNRFLSHELWDEARVCTSPKIYKEGIMAPGISLQPVENFKLLEDDWRVYFKDK